MRKEAIFIFMVVNLLLYTEAGFGTTTHVAVNKRDLLGLLENIFDQRKNFLISMHHGLL